MSSAFDLDPEWFAEVHDALAAQRQKLSHAFEALPNGDRDTFTRTLLSDEDDPDVVMTLGYLSDALAPEDRAALENCFVRDADFRKKATPLLWLSDPAVVLDLLGLEPPPIATAAQRSITGMIFFLSRLSAAASDAISDQRKAEFDDITARWKNLSKDERAEQIAAANQEVGISDDEVMSEEEEAAALQDPLWDYVYSKSMSAAARTALETRLVTDNVFRNQFQGDLFFWSLPPIDREHRDSAPEALARRHRMVDICTLANLLDGPNVLLFQSLDEVKTKSDVRLSKRWIAAVQAVRGTGTISAPVAMHLMFWPTLVLVGDRLGSDPNRMDAVARDTGESPTLAQLMREVLQDLGEQEWAAWGFRGWLGTKNEGGAALFGHDEEELTAQASEKLGRPANERLVRQSYLKYLESVDSGSPRSWSSVVAEVVNNANRS